MGQHALKPIYSVARCEHCNWRYIGDEAAEKLFEHLQSQHAEDEIKAIREQMFRGGKVKW